MRDVEDLDALLENTVDPRVAMIQLVRYIKQKDNVATNILDVVFGVLSAFTDGPSNALAKAEPMIAVRLKTADLTVLVELETRARDVLFGDVLQRCMAAAWPRLLSVVVYRDGERVEAWDPKVPFGIVPEDFDETSARMIVERAGFRIEEDADRWAMTFDVREQIYGSIDDTFDFMKSESEKALANARRLEMEKGQHRHLSVTMDREAITMRDKIAPVSEMLHREKWGRNRLLTVPRADILAPSLETLGDLHFIGPTIVAKAPHLGTPELQRALKHLLCARAIREGQGPYR